MTISAAAVWRAPAHWRAIDVISDLHLSPALPATTSALAGYLAQPPAADALLILGDLFEVWVGDDAVAQPFEAGLASMLRSAAAARPIYFMVGNRDFLAGDRLLSACGMQALVDPTCLHAWDRRWVLTHGDALCLDDLPYQQFRRTVRDAGWQRGFLAKPLAERLAFAAEVRRESRQRRLDSRPDADIDTATSIALLERCGAEALIHGHTHRPGSEPLDATALARHVLSDWDLDVTARPRAEVLRLSSRGVQRLDPRSAAAPL